MDIRTATLLCVLCLPEAALAAQQEDSATAEAGEEPEEVIVTGQRVRFALRLQMEDAERAVYNLFNEFNDEPRFEISCELHAITGTTLKTQVCQTEFERRALSQEGQDYLAAYRAFIDVVAAGGDPANQNYSPPTMSAPSALIIAPQQGELQSKMREIAETHPEFVDALVRFVEAKGRYDQSRGIDNETEETP
jgi:hypothetical protein